MSSILISGKEAPPTQQNYPLFFMDFFFRKRCINFLTSLDLFDALSVQKMFDLFKKNLDKASMLAYICIINLPSAEEEIKFIMGNQDIQQWNSRDQVLAPVAFR